MSTWIGRGLATGVLVACCQCAFALTPSLDVAQMVHTAWRIRDGFITGTPQAIAQTADGYIWLGTDAGLFRFDGVKVTAWQPPRGTALSSSNIRTLLAARDGTLWIGMARGLAAWDGRTLATMPQLSERLVGKLVEDREGTIWATVASLTTVNWMLCSLTRANVQCRDDGTPKGAIGLFEDRRGTLWVGTFDGLWRWKPGPPRFFPLKTGPNGLQGLAQAADESLLMTAPGGIRRFDGESAPIVDPIPSIQSSSAPLLRDRDGALWAGTSNSGLRHVHGTVTDAFTEADGLSGDRVTRLFEDREGSIWAVTNSGIDRFRDPPVALLSTRQGVRSLVHSLAPSADGGVWFATDDGLYRVRGSDSRVEEVMSAGSRPVGAQSLFRDHRGRLWFSQIEHVLVSDHEGFETVPEISVGRHVRAIAEDRDGIWFADQLLGLLRLSPDRHVEQVPWPALGRGWASAMTADAGERGVWLAFGAGGIGFFRDGGLRASYGATDGVRGGAIQDLQLDADGSLWAATDGGLTRVKNGRVATLTTREGLPCDSVQWTREDDTRSLWAGLACGVARIARSELDKWLIAVDSGRPAPRVVVGPLFDAAEGGRVAGSGQMTSPAVVSHGRLWFKSTNGAGVIELNHLPINNVPPPVHIEAIAADHKTYETAVAAGPVLLPPLTRDVQIDYTALSFVAPEKVRFRYTLDGYDRDWQDAGNRRQAFYTNLRPRNYRFRVLAANNSGVWNDTGAVLDFSIAAAYYQTLWFQALAALGVIGLVWIAHRVRVHIVEKHESEISALNERLMKAQEQERIRIAGELHDGVMQEMLAVTMMLGTAKRRIPDDSAAKGTIDKIQDKMLRLGTDIRRLSHDLHPPVLQEAGLPQALQICCDEFSAASGIPVYCEADDRARDLSRGSALALFRIVQEALGNAAKHARATRITVRLTRSDDRVLLIVADDGVGVDAGWLGAPGGLGLVMMRERATQLNGTFEFDSALGKGTTIRVVIPFR